MSQGPPAAPLEPGSAARRFFGCGCAGCLGLFFFFGMAVLVVVAIPDPVALGLAAAAAIMPVPTFVLLVLQLDRYEREPWLVLAVAFLWGALVAPFVSAILDDLIGDAIAPIVGKVIGDVVTVSAVAPVVEETSKGLAVFLLFWILRSEFDDVLDGIVYGSLVGIGFAMTENVLYFGQIYQQGGVVGLGVLFYIRVILGGFGHSLYTGTVGAALGFARETDNRYLATVVPLAGYGLAILQHGAWNFIAGSLVPAAFTSLNPLVLLLFVLPLESLFLTGPGLLTLLLIATFAWRREADVIKTHLWDEVGMGTIRPEEYVALPSLRTRFAEEVAALRRRGLDGWLAQRQFHQAATELAFRKWHLARGERLPRGQQITPEDLYRHQIAACRERLAQPPLSS
ncbi:MAG TPA: PrsW family intramembrane metalloprotease [Chloroflexota bacterium]|nr:PrsW family intramembrane metalloprotease [Chloroflexota bacterium]